MLQGIAGFHHLAERSSQPPDWSIQGVRYVPQVYKFFSWRTKNFALLGIACTLEFLCPWNIYQNKHEQV